uniref:Uncharacterized protein n=1 Tax=Plectus sambesii TaxID=2011161 RepID=A0A914WI08_9BILA
MAAAAVAVRRSIDAPTARNTIDISPLQSARLFADTVGAGCTSASSGRGGGCTREARALELRKHRNNREPTTDPRVIGDSGSRPNPPLQRQKPPRPAANRSPPKNKRRRRRRRRFHAALGRRVGVCLLFRARRIRASPRFPFLPYRCRPTTLRRSPIAPPPPSPSVARCCGGIRRRERERDTQKRDTRRDTTTTATTTAAAAADRYAVRICCAAAGDDEWPARFAAGLVGETDAKVDAHTNPLHQNILRSAPQPIGFLGVTTTQHQFINQAAFVCRSSARPSL